jgi:hypothetical protein
MILIMMTIMIINYLQYIQLQFGKCGVNIFIQSLQIFLSRLLLFFLHILQGLDIFMCCNNISISIIIYNINIIIVIYKDIIYTYYKWLIRLVTIKL